MLEQIKALLPLQEIDKKVYLLKTKLKDFEPSYVRIDQEISKIKENVQSSCKKLEDLKLLHKEMELELGKKESELKKFQAQQFQVKTNKEYSALQDEIKKSKVQISELEDKILALLDNIEQEEVSIKKIMKESEQKIAQLEAEKEAKHLEEKKIKEEIETLLSDREKLANSVDKKVLEHYEKILKHRGGVALCKVDKRGICTGCFLSLAPQVLNELIIGEKLIHCESCGCILYYEE